MRVYLMAPYVYLFGDVHLLSIRPSLAASVVGGSVSLTLVLFSPDYLFARGI